MRMGRQFRRPTAAEQSKMAGLHVRRDDDKAPGWGNILAELTNQRKGIGQMLDHVVHHHEVSRSRRDICRRDRRIVEPEVWVTLSRASYAGPRDVEANHRAPPGARELGAEMPV